MEKSMTERGFAIYEGKDCYGDDFSIQKSSLATEDAIWLGLQEAKPRILASKIIPGGTGWADYPLPEDVFINTRVHLTREQVAEILPILQNFVETGEI